MWRHLEFYKITLSGEEFLKGLREGGGGEGGAGEGGVLGGAEKVLLGCAGGGLREEGEGEEEGWGGGEEGRRLVQLVVDQIRKIRLGGGVGF